MPRLFRDSLLLLCLVARCGGAAELVRDEAAASLRQAVHFFRAEVSTEGGYLWRYSSDLERREGEGRAQATTIWVQPPGTPTVGEALLEAYRLTGEAYCRDAARDAAHALVRGQLRSGGWDYRVEFDPSQRRRYAYRVEGAEGGTRNTSTLDDDTTQSALRFLMHADQALQGEDASIGEAVRYALAQLLLVQYPNGAWPQRFEQPPAADEFPVLPASYPDQWSWSYPGKDYRSYYTFNDNSLADVIRTMVEAAELYGEPRYLEAARQAGAFVLLAQMPEPQPAWAQQYDAQMHPAWARKFEPPALCGGESQGILRTLLFLYEKTGERKFLAPIPPALNYLARSRRGDGRLARFYELRTNRPLYFTKDYQLTYDDRDMPTHYAFVVDARLESIQTAYERLVQWDPAQREPPVTASPIRLTASLRAAARSAIDRLDDRGAWVEEGRLRYFGDEDPTTRVIDCRTFVDNVRTLARYLAACDAAAQGGGP